MLNPVSLSSLESPNNLTTNPTTNGTLNLINGEIRPVNLESRRLPSRIFGRLRQRSHFPQTQLNSHSFSTTSDAIAFWQHLLPQVTHPFKETLEIENDHFLEYLKQMTQTAEYEHLSARPILAERIISIIHDMQASETFKLFVLEKMEEALNTCDDRVIHVLDQIELHQLVEHAKQEKDPQALEVLGASFKRLNLLHIIIRKELIPKMTEARINEVRAAGRQITEEEACPDEIEVILACELRLRKTLNLPTKTQNMIFRTDIKLSDQEIDEIGERILRECTDDNIKDYLMNWEPWQKYLRTQDIQISYESLEPIKLENPLEPISCPISMEEPKEPVIIGKNPSHIFELESLKEAYIYNPINPLTKEHYSWSDVQRAIII